MPVVKRQLPSASERRGLAASSEPLIVVCSEWKARGTHFLISPERDQVGDEASFGLVPNFRPNAKTFEDS